MDVPLTHWQDDCEDRRYNDSTTDEPCGHACESRVFEFKTCGPVDRSSVQFFVCVLYSLVSFELTYTIFSALADVHRGFRMREIAARYLLDLTPHNGAHSHLRQDAFGLLPSFDLDRVSNIIAWNRMRMVLQTWDSDTFDREQHKVTFILLIPIGLLVAQLCTMAHESDFQCPMPDWEHNLLITRRLTYTDRIESPSLDFLSAKVMLLQMLGSGLIGGIVWIGSNITQMYEHELPHLLMLKKAELQSAGYPSVPSLHHSTNLTLVIWCKVPADVAHGKIEEDAKISLREYFKQEHLHERVARVAVRCLAGFVARSSDLCADLHCVLQGISTANLGLSIRDERESRKAHRVGEEPAYDRHSAPDSPGARRAEQKAGTSATGINNSTTRPTSLETPRSALVDEYMNLRVYVHEGQDILVDVWDMQKVEYDEESFEGTQEVFRKRPFACVFELYKLRALQMSHLCTSFVFSPITTEQRPEQSTQSHHRARKGPAMKKDNPVRLGR